MGMNSFKRKLEYIMENSFEVFLYTIGTIYILTVLGVAVVFFVEAVFK